MGTRHLIAVVLNDEYKIAQYGQWDGYPSGQGVDILRFLKETNLEKFQERVSNCKFMTKEFIEDAEAKNVDLFAEYPYVSRDTGAKIFDYLMDSEGEFLVVNKVAFAKDSLFCEWAYVIDLDNNTFEVYEGFNKSPLNEHERFYDKANEDNEDGYYPVAFNKEWSLNNLPSEQEFLKALQPKEEDEE